MLEIASTLTYVEFDDLKEWKNSKEMWDKLKIIYGGDDNVSRAILESLRGKFDEMKMIEGENIVQYCSRIKEVSNAIRGANVKIEDETIINFLLGFFNIRPKMYIR